MLVDVVRKSTIDNQSNAFLYPPVNIMDFVTPTLPGISLSVMKSAYILLIIGPRGLVCQVNLLEIMGSESTDVVRFDIGSLLQGQMRIAKFKSTSNFLIIGPRGLVC